MFESVTRNWMNRARREDIRVYYHEAYRLPLSSGDSGQLEVRRADDAAHYLLKMGAVAEEAVVTPEPISYEDLQRVHTPEYLESLHLPETLAKIFAVDVSDVLADELLQSIRLSCGGTLAAARHSVATGEACLNLLGGFHHAAPDRGAGFCALNDVAVAIAALRSDGFELPVAILDLDFHPPDGTDACLTALQNVWMGSLSGEHWGPLPHTDETQLPLGTPDEDYLAALDALLQRVPQSGLYFILSGADVLAGDRLGGFSLSLGGVRERDVRVKRALGSSPQVWLPAGGYSTHAWKILAGTGLVLALESSEAIALEYDPLAHRLEGIAKSLQPESLSGDALTLSEADVADAMGLRPTGPRRLLGFYTTEGIEYALERYRFLQYVRRLGYSSLRVSFDRVDVFDRARLTGRMGGEVVTLVELEVTRKIIGPYECLFVNWMTLRNPRAKFSSVRPKLPGQDVPGLGLAKELIQLMTLMAKRLSLQGVASCPSWYHMAFAGRHDSRFLNPERQGRFEALTRDLKSATLLEATRAVAEGRVHLLGAPYAWEADDMVRLLPDVAPLHDAARVQAEKERCHFERHKPKE
jgi:acetoin utilization deacetylase AcuC-like enzyme